MNVSTVGPILNSRHQHCWKTHQVQRQHAGVKFPGTVYTVIAVDCMQADGGRTTPTPRSADRVGKHSLNMWPSLRRVQLRMSPL